MIKKILIGLLHNYQADFNESLYWKRRLYVQKGGGKNFFIPSNH